MSVEAVKALDYFPALVFRKQGKSGACINNGLTLYLFSPCGLLWVKSIVGSPINTCKGNMVWSRVVSRIFSLGNLLLQLTVDVGLARYTAMSPLKSMTNML